MIQSDLIYNTYQKEDIFNNYSPTQKTKIICFINNIICFLEKYNDYDSPKFETNQIVDIEFLVNSFYLLQIYEKSLLKNKYLYYNREEFWTHQMLLMIIMYKYNFTNMEQYVICTLDRIIKNMFQNNSIIMLYPEYLKNGKIKKEYENLSMEELEKKYREEFGNRYDDKLID